MRRRVVQPLRHVGLLIALGTLPGLVLAGGWDASASRSVLHVLLCFAGLMLAFRILGKRELSRLSPFELVTLMLIPEVLSNTVQGQASLLQSLAGLCTLLLLVLLTSLLSQRFEVVGRLLQSPPTVLVADGRLLEPQMNRERIAPDEILSEMRKQGIARLADVRFAVLESGGSISFVQHQPRQRARDEEQAAGGGT